MISFRSSRSGGTGMLRATMIGLAAAFCLCAIAIMIVPIFILEDFAEPKSLSIITPVIQLISSFFGANIAGLLINDKKWMTASTCSALLCILLICIGMLFFEGDPNMLLSGFISCAIGAFCSIVLLNRKKKSTKKKRIKHRSR